MPSATELLALRAFWRRTCRPLRARAGAADEVFSELVARYSGPGRFYHTLAHVAHMAKVLRRLCAVVRVRDATAVRLAVWFHDAVYDPRVAENEEQSARLAATLHERLNISRATLAAVQRLVLATKTHKAAPHDADACVLLDVDLAILGADAAGYDAYARAIRLEYAWVPPETYRTGRARVLRGFLERPRIYFTSPMFPAFEARARRNIRRELKELGGPV